MSKALVTACISLVLATGCSGQTTSSLPSTATTSSVAVGPATNATAATSLQTEDKSTLVAAPAANPVLFSETFDQDAVNAPAAAWTTNSGSWSVCKSADATNGYCQTSTGSGISIPKISATSWGAYQVDADLLHASSAGAAALLARMSDSSHFYQFEIRSGVSNPSQQTWDLAKYDGSWKTLVGGTFSNALASFAHVRLVVSGASIEAYAGKNSVYTLLGKATDSSFATGGIGLRTWGTNKSAFDNITVSALGASGPSPTPSPTASIKPAPPSGVATFQGCPVFTAGDWYNRDISNAPVDPHSSDYLSSVESVDNTGFSPTLNIEPVNIASNSTPMLTVHQSVSYHKFPNPYPWASGYSIENSSDRHYVAVNTQSCHLYEGYGMSYSGGVLTGYSGRDFDLRQPFQPGIGVTATGLSYFAGAARHEEVATGIHHAIALDMWSNALCNCFVAPAAETDGVPYQGKATSYQLPYGAHLRLKSTYNCSSWGPQSAAVCAALKHYGTYVSDTDGHYSNNNKLWFVDPTTDGGTWNSSDLNALNALRFSDFDVLALGKNQS